MDNFYESWWTMQKERHSLSDEQIERIKEIDLAGQAVGRLGFAVTLMSYLSRTSLEDTESAIAQVQKLVRRR